MSRKYFLGGISEEVVLKIEEFLDNVADPTKDQYLSSSVLYGVSSDIDIFETGYEPEEISTDNYTGKVGEIHHIKVSGNPPVDSYYIPKD